MKASGKPLLLCMSLLFLFSLKGFAQNGTVTLGGGLVAQLGPRGPEGQRGAPYSAVRETEIIQTLSDGTHITRKSHTRFYRDSQGRTRQEMFPIDRPGVSTDEPGQIVINDPVEGVNYSLNPRNHTGTRNNFRTMVPQQPPPKQPVPMPMPLPPARREPMPQPNREDLGTQMIEGIWTKGSRMTTTIPVNVDGNDRPLITVFENWFSDELQTLVLSKRSDPRTGETTDRLINIDRSEPDPALFRPPADYTITEPQRQ